MNKKFSTLATAGLLLSGALFCNVNAKDYNAADFAKLLNDKKILTLPEGEKDLVVNLTENVSLGTDGRSGAYMVINTKDVVLTSNADVTLAGRLVIGAENVTVKNMTLINNPANEDANGYWTKNAVTAFAAKLTVVGNTFVQGARATGDNVSVSNGLVIFPQAATASYNVTGNTFTNNFVSSTGTPNYASAGVIIQEGLTLATKSGDPFAESELKGYGENATVEITSGLDAAAMAQNNTFNECFSDFLYIGVVPTVKSATTGAAYKFAQVTYDAKLKNSDAVVDVVASSIADAQVVVNGATYAEVLNILEAAKTTTDVAGSKTVIACDDALVLLGGATVPVGNTMPVVSATVSISGVVCDAAAQADAFKFDTPFILSANSTNRKALKADAANGFAIDTYDDKTDASFFWSFEKSETGATTGYAKLVNSDGKYLKISDKYVGVKIEKSGNNWIPSNKLDELALVNVEDGTSVTTTGATAYTLCAIGTRALTAGELLKIYGAGFEAEILYDKKPLNANPFTGILKPVRLVGKVAQPLDKTSVANSYMLQNAEGNMVVVRLDQKYSVGTADYGYKVIEMTPADLALALAGKDAEKYACYFSFNALDNFVAGKNESIVSISTTTQNGTSSYVLGALEVGTITNLAAELSGTNVLKTITVKVGTFNKIVVEKFFTKPVFYSVTVVNNNKKAENYGKVLGLDATGKPAYVKAENALVGQPETQWAVTYNAGIITLRNREYPNAYRYLTESPVGSGNYSPVYFAYSANNLYKTSDPNTFADYNTGDTIKISPVAEFLPSDGFERLDADKLRDQLYYVGIQSSVWKGIAYAVENHKENHQIGLDTDKENATEWHLAAAKYTKLDDLGDELYTRPDTIKIGSTLGYFKADGTYVTSNDDDGNQTVFLKLLSYSLMNQANNEFMNYNNTKDVTRYTTGNADNTGNLKNPQYFALKIVGKNANGKALYNLLEVNKNSLYADGQFQWYNNKVYGGDSADKGILNRTDMYAQTENDLFVVEEKDAPEYVKLNQGDTIKIYRSETESDVLYQKGEFLGMGNAIEFNKINPALYVDTVYYNRGANNRWEYLLGINVTRIDTTYKCNVPSHGIHQADTTYGAFLVNYADSAIVEDTRDIHTNKYVYDNGTRYAKLGFEEGFRTNDTLYVARADGKFDKIEVGAPSRQLVKFAFRVMDHDANTFIVETGYKYPQDVDHSNEPATGYLRWINGNVVVTPNMEDAEVFKLKADDRNPVANEDLTASSVAVIAGEGQITVNGAAGKVVTITNVLGQTVLNSVISSDNATIAAPAGIVIVSVEGEAAVKAIVK